MQALAALANAVNKRAGSLEFERVTAPTRKRESMHQMRLQEALHHRPRQCGRRRAHRPKGSTNHLKKNRRRCL